MSQLSVAMANLAIGGMKTLKQSMEVEGASNQVLLDVWKEVEHSKVRLWEKADLVVQSNVAKKSEIGDIPASQYNNYRGTTTRSKYCLDVLLEWKGSFGSEQILVDLLLNPNRK